MGERAEPIDPAALAGQDEDGFALAFDFGADGGLAAPGEPVVWRWRNHALADARARRRIEADSNLPEGIRAGLLASSDGLLLDYEEGWLHGAITDTRHRHYTEASEIGHFRFAFNDAMLVSARRHPLQSVDDLRRQIEQRKKTFRTPAELTEAIVLHSLDRLAGEITAIGAELDSIEDGVVGDSWHRERERLTSARRRLVFVHRHVAGVSSLFRHAEPMLAGQMPEPLGDLVARLSQRATTLLQDSEQMQSKARLLQDELMAKLSAESNRLLYVLSVLTAVLMPMSIISGLFGMNVGGVPLAGSGTGFWLVSLASFAVAAGVFVAVNRIGRRR
jgi:zinc transporter